MISSPCCLGDSGASGVGGAREEAEGRPSEFEDTPTTPDPPPPSGLDCAGAARAWVGFGGATTTHEDSEGAATTPASASPGLGVATWSACVFDVWLCSSMHYSAHHAEHVQTLMKRCTRSQHACTTCACVHTLPSSFALTTANAAAVTTLAAPRACFSSCPASRLCSCDPVGSAQHRR